MWRAKIRKRPFILKGSKFLAVGVTRPVVVKDHFLAVSRAKVVAHVNRKPLEISLAIRLEILSPVLDHTLNGLVVETFGVSAPEHFPEIHVFARGINRAAIAQSEPVDIRAEQGVVVSDDLQGEQIVVAKPDILLKLTSGYALKIKE